mmetsp:Transcript_3199/g.10530  ORF Transcript_3199/g.10530 Transcript_3199/m.10530 type:complete len:309 (-) Transcript_3199:417-1343(-)
MVTYGRYSETAMPYNCCACFGVRVQLPLSPAAAFSMRRAQSASCAARQKRTIRQMRTMAPRISFARLANKRAKRRNRLPTRKCWARQSAGSEATPDDSSTMDGEAKFSWSQRSCVARSARAFTFNMTPRLVELDGSRSVRWSSMMPKRTPRSSRCSASLKNNEMARAVVLASLLSLRARETVLLPAVTGLSPAVPRVDPALASRTASAPACSDRTCAPSERTSFARSLTKRAEVRAGRLSSSARSLRRCSEMARILRRRVKRTSEAPRTWRTDSSGSREPSHADKMRSCSGADGVGSVSSLMRGWSRP